MGIFLQQHDDAGGLQQRRDEEERGRGLFEALIRRADQRQHEGAKAGAQRQQDAARGVEVVPSHADVNRQADEDENPPT